MKIGDIVNFGPASGGKFGLTIGHKGQEGSDPDYPDKRDHIATVIKVESNGSSKDALTLHQNILSDVITRRCSCGLEWSFPDRSHATFEPEEYRPDRDP